MKIKTNKLLSKCLLKTAIKIQVFGKPQRRKLALLTAKFTRQAMKQQLSKIFLIHLQEVAMNSFKASEDEENNDNLRIDNNPQKSQPEVKRRPNIAVTENLISSQNIKTVPGNRTYVNMTKHRKKMCIIVDSYIRGLEEISSIIQ